MFTESSHVVSDILLVYCCAGAPFCSGTCSSTTGARLAGELAARRPSCGSAKASTIYTLPPWTGYSILEGLLDDDDAYDDNNKHV